MSCYSPRSAKHPQLATKMMRADAGLHRDEGAHAFPQIPKTFFASARLVHLISCPECSARVLPAHKCRAGGSRARERQQLRSKN
jgi:hypothetical protein